MNTAIKLPKGMQILAPIYKDSIYQKVAVPTMLKWKKRQGDVNALSHNPNDCFIFAYAEIAPVYINKHHLKMLQPPRKVIGQDTIALDNKELASYGAIETKYEQITYYHEVLKKTGNIRPNQPLNRYRYVSHHEKVVRFGGFTEWKEYNICGRFYPPTNVLLKVQKIQKSLQTRGYYKGKIDGVIGAQTKAALIKFQKDNGLPIGSLDLQTQKVLGVGFE